MKFHSHRNSRTFQVGRGVGAFFSKIFSAIKRFIVPGVKKIATSHIGKNVAKSIGKAAVTSASSFGGELLAGKTAQEAGRESLNKGIKDLQKSVNKMVNRKTKKDRKGEKDRGRRKKKFTFFDP